MKNGLLALAAVAGASVTASSALAAIAYDYQGPTGGPGGLVLNQPRSTNNGDFGTLAPLAPGLSWSITSVVVARAHGTTNGSFDVGFFLWGGVNTSGTGNIFSNLLSSGSFNRSVTTANQGQIFTTQLNFTPGSVVLPGGATFGYQMVYGAPGSINLNTAAFTPTTLGVGAFYIDKGTSGAGDSTEGFFSNNNAAGTFAAGDFGSFASPNGPLSNVFLIINADVVPAPASAGLLGLGGLLAARRRRA